MTNLNDLRPGDVFVTPTYGSWFDRIVGASIRFGTGTKDQYSGSWHNADVNHTGVYVGDGLIVEAAPGGARYARWDSYGDNARWGVLGRHVTEPGNENGRVEPLNLTDSDRLAVAAIAKSFAARKIGYGYADIVAVGLAQRRLHGPIDVHKALAEQPWWVRQIAKSNTLICSQLDDRSFKDAGFQIYDDDRLPGLVSPVDIESLFVQTL